MIENARYLTRYTNGKRTAELFELDDKTGYIVRMIESKQIKEDRIIQGKSIHYVVDTCENWCEGIIDPWI
ncbi:hypothetical protein OAU13_00225 [bacterium]|nr:hypothetical protein [bacterium]